MGNTFNVHKSITIQAAPSKVWNVLRQYTNKGKIIHIIPEKLLHILYPEGLAELEDFPPKEKIIMYQLEAQQSDTTLHIIQENIEDEQSLIKIEKLWDSFFVKLKQSLIEDAE